jgi:hypothetical protein
MAIGFGVGEREKSRENGTGNYARMHLGMIVVIFE